jgi:protease-4
MARRHPRLRRLAILAGAVVAVLALLELAGPEGGGLADIFALRSAVGLLELTGVIQDAGEAIDTLERFRRHSATVAVVLRIDSPGGAVAPAQELYDAVWRLRERKPVVASLGNVAASGGYYVASAANLIVADPGTITGSIGAIMGVPYYKPLAEKVGISEDVVKSGRYKDTGHPLRPLSADERALLQGMVDDVLGQFIEAVARGRGIEVARVRELADGRIYSGAQAQAVGLVDRLGSLDTATRLAWEQAGQRGEPRVRLVRLRRPPWWLRFLDEARVAGPPQLPGLLLLYPGPVLE